MLSIFWVGVYLQFVGLVPPEIPHELESLFEEIDQRQSSRDQKFIKPAFAEGQKSLTEAADGPVDPIAIGENYAAENAEILGVRVVDVLNAPTRQILQSPVSSIWFIKKSQYVSGIPVFGSELKIAVSDRAEVFSVSSNFISKPETKILSLPGNNLKSPLAIMQRALRSVDRQIRQLPSLRWNSLQLDEGAEMEFLGNEILQEGAKLSLVYFPLDEDRLVLSYHFRFQLVGIPIWMEFVLDAYTEEIYLKRPNVFFSQPLQFSHAESFTVLPAQFWYYSHSPFSWLPGPAELTSEQLDLDFPAEPSLASSGNVNLETSPLNWLGPLANASVGNNVEVQIDTNENFYPDNLFHVYGDPFREFRFPIDFYSRPLDYIRASASHLFVLGNYFHDYLYQIGFDEASGNFQLRNFSGQGAGNDRMRIFPQLDMFGFVNNAMFSGTGVDGDLAAVSFFNFIGPTPHRDSSLETAVVYHELAHGLTMRMIGAYPDHVEAKGMMEGWSDFYALALLAKPGQDVNGTYPMAGHLVYKWLSPSFDQNFYFGIRRYPYSTRMEIAPLTYADIDPTQYYVDPSIPRSPVVPQVPPHLPHGIGEIWASALWELTANMVSSYGFMGYLRTMFLATEALRYTPSQPTMVDGRDALLISDQVLFNGQSRCLIWQAMAKRGLGSDARSIPMANPPRVTESFHIPAECR